MTYAPPTLIRPDWSALTYRLRDFHTIETARGVAYSGRLVDGAGTEVGWLENAGQGGADSWTVVPEHRAPLSAELLALCRTDDPENILDDVGMLLLGCIHDYDAESARHALLFPADRALDFYCAEPVALDTRDEGRVQAWIDQRGGDWVIYDAASCCLRPVRST